jgi:hypothetical protein
VLFDNMLGTGGRKEETMLYLLMWLLGVPLGIIVLLWLLGIGR